MSDTLLICYPDHTQDLLGRRCRLTVGHVEGTGGRGSDAVTDSSLAFFILYYFILFYFALRVGEELERP